MRNDFKIILVIFLVMGEFIFIKGFQNNLGIMDIITIYTLFICFIISFTFLTASITNFIIWISNI